MTTRRHRLAKAKYDNLPKRKRFIISTRPSKKKPGSFVQKIAYIGGFTDSNGNSSATHERTFKLPRQQRPGRLRLPSRIKSKPNPILIDWPNTLVPGLATANYFDAPPVSAFAPAVINSLLQSWGVDPDYAYKKRNKIPLITQPFLRYERWYKTPSGSVDYYPAGQPDLYHRVSGQFKDQYVEWQEGIGLTTSWQFDGHLLLKNSMSNNLLNKVKGMKVNVAQTFAERQQVYNLVGDTAKTLANAFTRLRRRDLNGFLRELGIINPPKLQGSRFGYSSRTEKSKGSLADPFNYAANKWAEYRWGWMPLYQDLYNSLELLQGPYKRKRRVTTTKEIKNESTSTLLTGLGNAWPLTIKDGFLLNGKGSCRFEVGYPVSSALSAFGLTNPALLAWEVLPYSFVVDSFLNIGNWLSTMDATLGMVFIEGTWSSRQIFYRSVEAKGTTSSGPLGTWTYEGYGNSLAREKILFRERMISWPESAFPSFENPLSLTHALDGIALLVQAFRR